MFETLRKLVKRVGQKLNIDEAAINRLLKADAEHTFEINLKDGKHFKAYRVQHSNKLGPYKGGIRFHPQVSLEEVRALALLMSLKAAAVGLPLGGSKGGVAVNPKELNMVQLEELSRKYVAHLYPYIGPDKDIPAPDVGTNPKIIDWMVDEYQKLTGEASNASFTGKSLAKGGSEGRDEATGRGGVIALSKLLRLQAVSWQPKSDQKLTYAVQGFGNVGAHFALVATMEQPGWQLVAASDSGVALYSAAGLDAKDLANYKEKAGRFSDYKHAGTKIIAKDELLALDVDVLVLAALEDAIIESNMKDVKARVIVEMANDPVNLAAHDYLTSQGVIILPDIIANAGGVIVSYFEWLQNKAGGHWPLAKVDAELGKYITQAVDEVYKNAKSQTMTLKEAAMLVALKHLTK